MLIIYLSAIENKADEIKMTRLYGEYHKLVFSIAMKYLRNREDAEDATHETFLRILKHLEKINEISCHKTKSFIVIISKNICMDRLRSKNKAQMINYEDMEYQSSNEKELEEIADSHSKSDIVKKIISELDPIYSEILILRYYNDLSYDEISALLKIKKSTVRKRAQRAKEFLSERLSSNRSFEVIK